MQFMELAVRKMPNCSICFIC